MRKRLWTALGIVLALTLVSSIAVVAEPGDPEQPVNTLRIYGDEDKSAPFPYEPGQYAAPFDLTGDAMPLKDFVVWNPAYMSYLYDDYPMYDDIRTSDGADSYEKVFLKQWYVPELEEPLGKVWTDVTPVESAHIVKEYTYMLLGADNNPVASLPGETAFALPIADRFPQIGLDSFDADGDGIGDVTLVNGTNGGGLGDGEGDLDLSTADISLSEGDWIEFLDHAVHITTVDAFADEVVVDVYYTGYQCGADLLIADGVALNTGDPVNGTGLAWLTAGRTGVWDQDDKGVNDGLPTGVSNWDRDNPWYLLVKSVTNSNVTVRAGRLLERGESFFVDGAEYAVAAIYTTDDGPNAPFKYITLRNPLCKGEDGFWFDELTLKKCCVDFEEHIPFLPPFNDFSGEGATHDIIDDVNLPESGTGVDVQYPDNPGTDIDSDYDMVADRIVEDQLPAVEYYVFEDTEPRFDTNLLEEKFLEPQVMTETVEGEVLGVGDGNVTTLGPVDYDNWDGSFFADCDGDGDVDADDVTVYYDDGGGTLSETGLSVTLSQDDGYVDFDGAPYDAYTYTIDYCYSYLEPEDEIWQWITIDTNPNAYTEFVMPEIDDADGGYGDYILVSSFRTEDCVEYDDTVAASTTDCEHARMKFAYDAQIGKINSADVYVNDATYNEEFYDVAANSLRLYANAENAAMSTEVYATYKGPFDITSDEAPPKDFLVWNPAYFSHSEHPGDPFLEKIKQNGDDGNEKVFLRQWYAPDLAEPLGWVWTAQDPIEMDHIVKEYTYFLLDKQDQPVASPPGETQFAFPMADDDPDHMGLDSFDVNGDGENDIAYYDEYSAVFDGSVAIKLQTKSFTVNEQDVLRFLDHRVEVADIDPGFGPFNDGTVDLNIFYQGVQFGGDDLDYAFTSIENVDEDADPIYAGRKTTSDTAGKKYPWFVEVLGVQETSDGTKQAQLRVGRWLWEGESFFVDGTEYFVPKIFLVDGDYDGCADDLKYITIRNPLCKQGTGYDGPVLFRDLTVWKTCIAPQEEIPFLPPFNMDHDIIDDVDINVTGGAPDEQQDDSTDISARVLAEGPVVEYYIDETDEPRFDTNLLEEKFTYTQDGDEVWRWINIETRPWSYTEFVLPEIQDVVGSNGDYILVSSWMTEDDVRMKFTYDATDGTGLYVNTLGEFPEPAPCVPPANVVLTADPMEQLLGESIVFSVEADGTNLEYEWNFGGVGTLVSGGQETGEFLYSGTGTYDVTVTVSNDCGEATDTVRVKVVDCDPPVITAFDAPESRFWGQTATFAATVEGDGPFDYLWDFGDAGAGTLVSGGQETGEYLFAAPGTYMVELEVTGACLGLTDTASAEIEIEQFPGDVNGDCTVNVLDVQAIVARWFSNDTDDDWDPIYDFTGPEGEPDGKVNVLDVQYVVNRMGTSCSD